MFGFSVACLHSILSVGSFLFYFRSWLFGGQRRARFRFSAVAVLPGGLLLFSSDFCFCFGVILTFACILGKFLFTVRLWFHIFATVCNFVMKRWQ